MNHRRRFNISELKGTPGKIRDRMKAHHIPPKLLFFLVGIISSVWFLIRVIPKPSRAGYPCMKVAAPIMSGFILYLLSIGGISFAIKRIRQNLINSRYLAAGVFVLVVFTGLVISITTSPQFTFGRTIPATGPDDGPNHPIGKAQGVNPGRVVWIWDPEATNEHCTTNYKTKDWYWKPENTNERVVGRMFRDGFITLSNKSEVPDSWDILFHYFNKNKHNADRGYITGEKIFIKINQGTARWLLRQEDKDKGYYYPEDLDPTDTRRITSLAPTETGPYIVLEMLRELVNQTGINQEDIAIGDPMADIFGHNYEIWHSEFPNVVYVDKFSEKYGRKLILPTENNVLFYSDKSQSDKIYDVMEKADYLINLTNLKPHASAGITSSAKNHFGSIARPTAGHLHYSLVGQRNKPLNGGYGKYRVQVDLMGSRYLGQNTLLFVIDGLFGGGSIETKGPVKYFMPPFNDDWCNSIFLSVDQVALESVCYDFLRTEWNGINKHDPSNNTIEDNPNWNGVDDYLHQAAEPSNWPQGIVYDPDNSGKPLTSMGVHEHWNDPLKKQYSRNLGTGDGIELLSIPGILVAGR